MKVIRIILFLLVFGLFFTYSNTFSKEKSWKLVDEFIISPDSSHPLELNMLFSDIQCTDSMNCIAICHSNTYVADYEYCNRITSDGGKTWFSTMKDVVRQVLVDTLNNNYIWVYPPAARAVSYKNPKLCIVTCDSGYYWRSTDTCKTWKKHHFLPSYAINNLISVDFCDTLNGGMISYRSIYLSFDGGLTWKQQDMSGIDSSINKKIKYYEDIVITEPGHAFVLTDCFDTVNYSSKKDSVNWIVGTKDSGKSWQVLSELHSIRISKIYFLNSKKGWAVGGNQRNYSKDSSAILFTEDGGLSWVKQLDTLEFPNERISDISFSDSLNGVALSEWWGIWKTSDGGRNWIKDTSTSKWELTMHPVSIAYPSASNIIACGDRFIYKYSDDTTCLGVEEFEPLHNNNNAYIYPNPATEFLKIKDAEPGDKVQVFSVLGEKISDSIYSGSVDISGLQSGLYFLRLGTRYLKFVKM